MKERRRCALHNLEGDSAMSELTNVRRALIGLSILAASLVGAVQGPLAITDQGATSLLGMGSEDWCVYSNFLNACPNEPGETGCTFQYDAYETWGYLTVLTITMLPVSDCADILYDEWGELSGNGPCDDGTGDVTADDTDCQESC